MGCEQNCFNEHRLEELEKVVREMKEKHSKRDGIFFERINALETKIVLYNNDLGHIKDTVDEMNDNLNPSWKPRQNAMIRLLFALSQP